MNTETPPLPAQTTGSSAEDADNPDDLPLSSDVPLSGPEIHRGLWTVQREELRDALKAQNSLCAQLYREAVEAVGAPRLDVGKLVVAGHAVRELVNLLPAVLGDVDLPERVDDADLRDGLVATWSRYVTDVNAGSVAAGALPSDTAKAINAWVQAQVQITANAEARRAALVLGTTGSADDSSVRVVIRAVGAFERLRHPSKGDSDAPVYGTAYQEALAVIENAITSRILGFFAVKERLRDVVDAANLKADDGAWKVPAENEVSATLAQIGGLQHRRIFYDQLNNPEWVEPLDRLAAFEPPKAAALGSEQRWQPWPGGDYLVRMAELRPIQVREIMLRVIDEDSAWPATTRLLDAALRMPVTQSRLLAGAIRSQLQGQLDPNRALDVVTFIEQLGNAGELRLAMRLAQTVLRPRPSPDAAVGRRGDVQAGIDPYWYPEALNRTIAALTSHPKILSAVYVWLRLSQELGESWDPTKDWDSSSIWRPSISDHEQNYRHHDIADALIDALRDLAISQMESGVDLEQVMETLERDRMPIAMRIAVFALSAQVGAQSEVLEVAKRRVLDSDLLHRPWFFREYTQLATATLPLLDDDDYSQWEAVVDAGPQLSEQRRARIVESREEGQSEDEAFAQYATMRRHELLSAVGSDALRGRLLDEHTALVEELGEYEHAGFRSWHSSGSGEEAPDIAAELATMSPADVLVTLETWEPGERGSGTREGLAESLHDAVQARPGQFSPMTEAFVRLGDPYRSRFLDGIRAAVGSDASLIDWDAYLVGAEALNDLDRGDETTYPFQQVCNTLESAVSGPTTKIPSHLLADAVGMVVTRIDDANPNDADGFGSDHLTKALNTMRPVAVRTLIRLARAAKLAHSADFDSVPVIAPVLDAISSRVAPRDASLAVAAALGEGLSLMMWIDDAWTESWLAGATTSDTWGDVFVTTALTTNRTSTKLLDDLWPNIEAILGRTAANDPIEMGWRSTQPIEEVIGDHLMTLAMWGSSSPWPERIESYFSRVDNGAAASVLGEVGRRMLNTSEVAPELVERAEAIWDARQEAVERGTAEAEQLAQFYWWVHSKKFPVEWWLPRLAHVVEQIDFDGRSFIGEHIAEAAQTHPAEAVALMTRLLRNDDSGPLLRHGLITSAPKIIALGLRSSDEAVIQASQRLMDLLGDQGIVDMDDQVMRAGLELDDLG